MSQAKEEGETAALPLTLCLWKHIVDVEIWLPEHEITASLGEGGREADLSPVRQDGPEKKVGLQLQCAFGRFLDVQMV